MFGFLRKRKTSKNRRKKELSVEERARLETEAQQFIEKIAALEQDAAVERTEIAGAYEKLGLTYAALDQIDAAIETLEKKFGS